METRVLLIFWLSRRVWHGLIDFDCWFLFSRQFSVLLRNSLHRHILAWRSMICSSDPATCSWVWALPSLQGLASVTPSKTETHLLDSLESIGENERHLSCSHNCLALTNFCSFYQPTASVSLDKQLNPEEQVVVAQQPQGRGISATTSTVWHFPIAIGKNRKKFDIVHHTRLGGRRFKVI